MFSGSPGDCTCKSYVKDFLAKGHGKDFKPVHVWEFVEIILFFTS